ncbi:hypothetical protein F5050DRAFT_1810898 [Lentinula boryana]|uniref:DUF6697 domain-containing protein n=1 Tax=Lentinula boryana TaxID=40481 RepID=A0ABQ8Q4Y7_9AGAR|nr:hypothetical protein F5050DRAFT_1810898 [Lentinula boryana]
MLFLYQVWKGQSREKISGRVSSVATQDSGITQLRRLFYLALSSFVFPCIFSLIQVSIVFTNPDFFLAAYIFVSNLYIEIICVLFATIWAVKARAELDARFNPGAYPVISTEHNIVFGNGESYSESGTQIPHRVNVTTLGRKNTSPLNTYEVNELYAAGAFKVAVITLQCVGFNDSMYRLLLEQASKRNLNAVTEKRNCLSHWQATVKSSFDGSPGLKNGSVNNNRNPRYSLESKLKIKANPSDKATGGVGNGNDKPPATVT